MGFGMGFCICSSNYFWAIDEASFVKFDCPSPMNLWGFGAKS